MYLSSSMTPAGPDNKFLIQLNFSKFLLKHLPEKVPSVFIQSELNKYLYPILMFLYFSAFRKLKIIFTLTRTPRSGQKQ